MDSKNESSLEFPKLIKLFENFLIFLIASLIFVSPFVVNYNELPKGYELPKVFFWQYGSLIVILLAFLMYVANCLYQKTLIFKKSAIVPAVTILFFTISTILSPYPDVAVNGNEFRFQGLITYIIIILLAYVVYMVVNKYNWHFIALAFAASALVQSILSFNQFSDLIKNDPNLVLQGLWVNGTFGQANWFAGRVLIGVIFFAFFLGVKIHPKKLLQFIYKLYISLCIVFCIMAIFFSQSEWAIVCLFIAVPMIIASELLPPKPLAWFFRIYILVGAVASIYLLPKIGGDNLRIEIWDSIITIFFRQPYTFPQIRTIMFGFGFDTLGQVFIDHGMLNGLLVDRAHNFLLDILTQNGASVLAVFAGLLVYINNKLGEKFRSRIFVYTFIAFVIWIIRSVVHESGIVNMMDFLIIFACVLKLKGDGPPEQKHEEPLAKN